MKKVSIITPCYNGEQYVVNFLESILTQTYENIELVFVNDASTDSTEEIVMSYSLKFFDRGYSLIYCAQDTNLGQAAAINKGLKLFTGNYVMWMDSDDILMANAIERKVDYLEKHPWIDFVLCCGEIVKWDELDCKIGILGRQHEDCEDNLFKDLLDERNVVFCPGTILVRSESLRKVIPELSIYESREGQNWQLMLPLAYSCQYGYLDEILFKYVVHADSHSHQNRSYQQLITRRDNFCVLKSETIKKIDMSQKEREHWLDYIYNSELQSKYKVSLNSMKIVDVLKFRHELLLRNVHIPISDEIPLSYCKKIVKKLFKSV